MSTLIRAPAVLPIEAVVVVGGEVTAGGAIVAASRVGNGAATWVSAAVGAGTKLALGAVGTGALVAG